MKGADNSEFIRRDESGQPSGEFLGQLGYYMAMRTTGINLLAIASSPETLVNFANVARQTGVTTATDLVNPMPAGSEHAMREAVDAEDFPMRLVVAFQGNTMEPEEGVARMQELQARNSDKLRFSLVKMVADGSIQGFSARLKWPHYFNGAPNGLWYIEPDGWATTSKPLLRPAFKCMCIQMVMNARKSRLIKLKRRCVRIVARPPTYAATLPNGDAGAFQAHESARRRG